MAIYQCFRNVTYDATYLINTYKMSFVQFSKVNSHYQTIIFGFTLLVNVFVNENIESYTWLLRTWQNAIFEHIP